MSSSSCLGRAAVPVKRVWLGLSSRLGRPRRRATTTVQLSTYVLVKHPEDDRSDDGDTGVGVGGVLAAGLGRLRKEVRTCEYRDVHVMWEMLSSSSNGGGISGRRGGSRDDDVADDDVAHVAGKGAVPPATRRARRKGRKPALWSRLAAYCGAF